MGSKSTHKIMENIMIVVNVSRVPSIGTKKDWLINMIEEKNETEVAGKRMENRKGVADQLRINQNKR